MTYRPEPLIPHQPDVPDIDRLISSLAELDRLRAVAGAGVTGSAIDCLRAGRGLSTEQREAVVKVANESDIRAAARAAMDKLWSGLDFEKEVAHCVEILRAERSRLKFPNRARARRRFDWAAPRLSPEHREIIRLARTGMKLSRIGKALPRKRGGSMMTILAAQICWTLLCQGEAPPPNLVSGRNHVNSLYSESDLVGIAECFAHIMPKVDAAIAEARRRLEREAA
jgi:hypothetical protein